ncbi:ABC transporter C family member 3 [Camellia lanceoleosa]|uniref:ABC transporter C family member 3 n=1 Tax=Camellia lanceoleosa TaxID=1840588 RepID=A0ACC0H4P2_9ERIC|nr:ABC transporter C family member 3 [Camellia lanceoleosa]
MLQKAGIRAKAVLVAKIYNKGLIISCQSNQGHTSGEASNLMTVDAERIGDFGWYIHDPWMAVLNVFLGLAILYKNLGFASFAALVAIGLVMLANFPLGSLQEKFQEKLMEWKDKRMKAASEVLRNIRILKLQAWEMKFLSKIIELTNVEAGWLRKSLYTIAITTFVFWVAPTFVSMVTFGACMLLGIPLESGKVLSSLAIFRILRGPIYSLPDTFTFIYQTKVSLDQIASFLRLDDLHPDAIEKLARDSSKTAIEIVDGTFSWDVTSPNPTLKDISMSASHACSLKKDLEILPFGDQTVIGERGINLSGGRARIQIARALYQDADIFLFDDPFSAVDAHIGRHLLWECLLRLLASKTVIYVTHQVEFLSASDLILVMKDGRIAQAGKYNNILNSGTNFMELVGAHQDVLSTLDSTVAKSVSENLAISEEDSSDMGSDQKLVQKEETEHGQNGKGDDIVGQRKGQCVQEEEREKSRVGLSVYWKYITTAYGGALVPFILLAQVIFQLLQIGSNYWIAWAALLLKDVAPPVSGSTLITVYVALAIGCSFCILARALLLVAAWYKSATILFNRMHFCIFRAPMSFFDATPSGRILNRLIELVFLLAGIYRPKCTGFGRSKSTWEFRLFNDRALGNYCNDVASCMEGLHRVCSCHRNLHLVAGSATIRSFDQESRFIETSVKLIDGHSRPKFYNAAALEWLCLRLYMLSAITFAFSLVFLIFASPGTIDPSK